METDGDFVGADGVIHPVSEEEGEVVEGELLGEGGTELAPPTNLESALSDLDSRAQSLVKAVIDKIADECLEPAPAGDHWAGQQEIIKWAMESEPSGLGLMLEEAAAVVREAQTQLYAQDRPDDTHVQRTLALSRLRTIRRMLQKAMNEPMIQRRFEPVEVPSEIPGGAPKKVLKVVSEKHTIGIQANNLRMALLIEAMIEELTVKRQGTEAKTVIQMLEQQDVITTQTKDGVKAQIRSRRVNFANLGLEMQRKLLAKIKPESTGVSQSESEDPV